MPRAGGYTISEVSSARIGIVCDLCGRSGNYSRDRLIACLGDVTLPSLLSIIPREGGCSRAAKLDYHNLCKARFTPETIDGFPR